MRFVGLLLVLTSSVVTLNAQFKEYKKLDDYFSNKQYDKCIEQAIKFSNKEQNELMPVLYCAKANFELFKLSAGKERLNYIKQSMKYSSRIERIDKKKEATENYEAFMEELHKVSVQYADSIYYGEKKEDSKYIYDYIVKIYKDTTNQFYDFHPELKKATITSSVGINTKLENVNQTDKNGLKQGFWKKVYPNGTVAYEVYFKDNKPTGTHKRYHENGKLMAVLKFDDTGEWSEAKLYNEEEELIAEGKYKNKTKDGIWIYFKKGKKVAEENYIKGVKNGVSKTYYDNGKVSEEKHWDKGIENGVWRQYYQSGKIKLESKIDNGVRNSLYITYHPNGRVETRGQYKEDHMHGDWIYYDEKGQEIQRVNYNMGKTDQQDLLDAKENEIFKKLEKNKDRLKDPADYIFDPNEYLKNNGLKQ